MRKNDPPVATSYLHVVQSCGCAALPGHGVRAPRDAYTHTHTHTHTDHLLGHRSVGSCKLGTELETLASLPRPCQRYPESGISSLVAALDARIVEILQGCIEM